VFFPDGGDTDAGQLPDIGENTCGDLAPGSKMLKLEEVSVECKMNNENDVNPNLVIDYCISYKKPEEVVGTNMCDKCGKPTTMTFKYTGVDTKANSQGSDGISSGLKAEDEGSLSTVRIVTKGKGNKGKIYADVIVNLGETFVLEVAPGDSKFQNKLETEIYDETTRKSKRSSWR
jgi:hypothetical protein